MEGDDAIDGSFILTNGAEYVIIQIIEAFSKEVEMLQETCRNGFGKAKERGTGK